MSVPDYAQLVKQLVDSDPATRQSARTTLLEMDENAIDPLIDQFYAGVTDAEGVAILQIMAEIGGPDALSTLRNVFYFEDTRPILQRCAANGLLHNRIALSHKELEEVKLFLADDTGSENLPE